MSTIKFMDMNDKNMFPDLSFMNSKIRKTPPSMSVVRIENSSVTSSLSDSSKRKTQPCNSILNDKTCPYGSKCNFAHSLEELVVDICLYKNRCYLVRFENGSYANTGAKKCSRIHPEETKESFHKRCGTLKSFPNFPEKTIVPNMKCTKLCKNAYEIIFDHVEKKCDIENCTYAHSLEELNLLDCSFGSDCRHVERQNDNIYKNINLKKICVRKHPLETAENLCHRRREYDINLEKEEAEEARKKQEAEESVNA